MNTTELQQFFYELGMVALIALMSAGIVWSTLRIFYSLFAVHTS